MPGYSGGSGGASADYGEGMGTKGSAAADNSIGTAEGISNEDFNEAAKEAFERAIHRALGLSPGYQEAVDAPPPATPAPTSLHDMDESQFDDPRDNPPNTPPPGTRSPNMEVDIGIGEMDESQFDDPLDNASVFGSDDGKDFADPDFNLGTEANTPIGKQGQSTTNLQDSPVSPSFGTREEQEREIDRDYFEGKTKTGQALNEALNQDFDVDFDRFEQENEDFKFDLDRLVKKEQEEINKLDFRSSERGKRQRDLNALRDTDLFSKAYDFANPSALRGLAAQIMSTLGMKSLFGIAKGIESKAIKAGFFDRSTFADLMGQLQDPAAFGAMGNPLGTGGADQNKEVMKKIINNVEPWTKGLTLTQVQYYFDRPEELEWVRNLWSSMNPSAAV